MLQRINLASAEEIQRSKEVCAMLADTRIEGAERAGLTVELDRLTGKVLRKINDEILADLNGLDALFTGRLVRREVERYEVEVDNREHLDRWKWQIGEHNGQRMMYDPFVENPVYKPIPRVKVERQRVIFVCETNRAQIFKIKDLIMDFWSKCKGEFKSASIDKVLDAKLACENEIAAIDRAKMETERLSEVEFLDCEFIKKPPRNVPAPNPEDSDSQLFANFEQIKGRALGG